MKKGCSSVPPLSPPLPLPLLDIHPHQTNSHIQKQIIPAYRNRYRNAVSFQIFTRNIKKEKVALSISRNKQIVNKYSNEHSNKEERDD